MVRISIWQWPLPAQVFAVALCCQIISQMRIDHSLKSRGALPQRTRWEGNVSSLRRSLQSHKVLFPQSPLRVICVASIALCIASFIALIFWTPTMYHR
jgi:hypothetical protein